MAFSEDILSRLEDLEKKYEAMGQDMVSYLDGLLYSDYLTYWEYVKSDALLSLQHPLTSFPDEKIFIVYHQITELYFSLITHEFDQLASNNDLRAPEFLERMKRANRYFSNLIYSFDIMIEGMEREQFLKFRMALLPASGFQSGQFRIIEIYSTDFVNLLEPYKRDEYKKVVSQDIKVMYEHLYWKKGATELATGKKTLTLKQFEQKYSERLVRLGKKKMKTNLWKLYENLDLGELKEDIENEMRDYDSNVNINWALAHYKSAVKYLNMEPHNIEATGGTNWQKYLPPRYQRIMFFPELWSEDDKENWGRSWVKSAIAGIE
ncbi:MAG: tryptophan 2,3-dioxygenase [Flavobacteriales bacterium]|nr:tryptophan 2,3-dioxygenase [Flavobacteriales bacterium]